MQAKSLLYGRRIRGDVGPLNLDPARRLPGRIFGPAVSLTGYMQDYEEATNIQHFELGSRMQLIRGRVFYYARVATNPDDVGGVISPNIVPTRGCKNSLFQHVVGLPPPAAVAPVTPIVLAGATQVVVTVANTDGVALNGAIAANELVGGHIAIFPAGGLPAFWRGINREIIANTAVSVALGLAMTVTLDRPLPVAIGAGTTCACMASEYAAVQTGNPQTHPVVGVAHINAAALQYIWLQTWGPFWMSGQLTIGWPNAGASNNFQVVFRADGSLGLHGDTEVNVDDPTTHYAQHAGYIMTMVAPGTRGAPFVDLQIRP